MFFTSTSFRLLSYIIRAIAHAPDLVYPPDLFVPERFLRVNPTIDPMTYCFGFGRRFAFPSIFVRLGLTERRRVCPGRMLAENSIFLMTANIISAFDISHSFDKHGVSIPINVRYSSGLVS